MDELVQLLMQKTGLSQEKAQQVVDLVVGHLKEKLPAPIASHLDGFLGSAGSEGILGKAKSMAAGLGGMLGKKEE